MTRSTKASSADMIDGRPVKKRKTAREPAAATPRRHTRGMTTDAARKAVFNTPELLENIISFVSPADIRTKVQRLSRQWRNAVDSSPAIRSKLWMNSQNIGALQPTRFTDEQTFPASPHFGQHEIPIFSHTLKFNTILLGRSVESWRFYWREYSALQWFDKVGSDSSPLESATIDFYYHKSGDAHLNPDTGIRSTWRDMHLTDPPTTTGLVHLLNDEGPRQSNGVDFIKFAIRDSGGLTLGLVHDTIMAALPSGVRKMMATKTMFVACLYVVFDKST